MEHSHLQPLELPGNVSPEIKKVFDIQLAHMRALESENRELRRQLAETNARLDALTAAPSSPQQFPEKVWARVPKTVKKAWQAQCVRIAALELKVAELQKEVESLRRAAKRQAAPFSKGEPKANPKRPGRKNGHAGSRRPRPDHVDETIELRMERCPHCSNVSV